MRNNPHKDVIIERRNTGDIYRTIYHKIGQNEAGGLTAVKKRHLFYLKYVFILHERLTSNN
jgi:isocitrate dehydrogenase